MSVGTQIGIVVLGLVCVVMGVVGTRWDDARRRRPVAEPPSHVRLVPRDRAS